MLGRKKAQVFNKKFLCSILENGIFIKPLKYNFFFFCILTVSLNC